RTRPPPAAPGRLQCPRSRSDSHDDGGDGGRATGERARGLARDSTRLLLGAWYGPLLVAAPGAVPDLQTGAVGGAAAGGVEAAAGRCIHQVVTRGDDPGLCAGAVTVEQLDLRA